MNSAVIVSQLKSHERELRDMGVASLSIFGSTARGEAGPASDIDLAVRFDPAAKVGLFAFAAIEEHLSDLLKSPIDLVGEPARKPWIQEQIDKDRVLVF